MIPDELDVVQEVPQPLEHWYGDAKISEDNQALLSKKRVLRQLDNPPGWQFWKKNELRETEKLLERMNKLLDEKGINQLLNALGELDKEGQLIKVQLYNAQQEHNRSQSSERREELQASAKILRKNYAGIKRDRREILARLNPHRALIYERDNLAARIQEHYAAIAEAREEAVRTRDMDREVRLVAERIVLALNKLGFRHKKSKRDLFGKVMEVEEMCRFERLIATPDKVILKLDVSSLGLLGGHVDHLPYGVYAQDLVNEKVLTHLNVALQLPLTSPNLTGEADWYRGVWFVVDRLGIPDGLEEKVLYSTVMKRYQPEKRELMPVPLGVRSGRKINWIYLAKEPHVMINGVTGYGKSNAFQMLLSTLVSKHSPDEVRLIIADMKKSGDFSRFLGLPHLLDFAGEVEEAETLSIALYMEMRRRYGIISKITNNITKFNAVVAPEDKMPHIFFFFDEYPSINLDKKIAAVIHRHIALIAMQGRGAGVHLVVSGQQSYASDFPRTMLSNITAQFTARQNTVSGAQATTGSRETMKLKEIPGRYLFNSSQAKYQVQMPYIEDDEIEAACEMARRWPEPRPFTLPIVPRDEEEIEDRDPVELVLEIAFKHFDGALKARPIWERSDGALSMPKTTAIVKQLAAKDTVEWEGKTYTAIKQKGNFYQLIEEETTEMESDELEPVSA